MAEDNNSQPNQADNNANPTQEQQPILPPEDNAPAPVDPEYSQWAEKHKDLQTAYKEYKNLENRYSGSSKEGERLSNELAQAKQYQEKLVSELQAIAKRNPKLAEQIEQEVSALYSGEPVQTGEQSEQAQLPQEVMDVIHTVKARERAEADSTIATFRDAYKDYVNDENWEDIKALASSLDPVVNPRAKDEHGRPYTLKTALRAALILKNPNIIADQAKMEQLAHLERRDSASEPGDYPSGSSSGESLSELEEQMLRKFPSVNRDSYLRRKAQER